jgi:hypothetical protein
MGKWLTLAALGGLLVLAAWVFYVNWNLVDVDLPPYAWAMLIGAVVLGLLVGFGLMGLIFYSSRMGYDEPPPQVDGREDRS